ncbi:MAG TPA: DtxR family transcriptional regulator [Balneola sp.]|jgi:DtxR family Mn-dependent transcriptional regulator|nr:DtxR family transcriptional regulator [Bacteroidota bacterium]MAC06096.1 DtxR family transcriptional regulator [Balneola sp.]MAO77895.1 DtxR family transcriptional regulator [Balneola sp.]MBF63349.1 DtxR family transcriptional regulator [Balneola sp.]HAW78629.1 DtxR family transcriptional regulator [Balneola sp.]|tara:strand:- start:19608 stop:20267 length:660 start_codon:yes stop_codon:yes gene_type:complete
MSLSQSVEDYLKAIYLLETENEPATTNNIAESLSVSSASVTNMFKKLAKLKLINHKSYRGAELTQAGEKIALEVIRHHRLLELYLKEMMGYSWDEVHEEAEKLEHHISEQFEDKIAELLNDPTHDPHGDPIPSKEGVVPQMASLAITDAEENTSYIIGRVRDQDPELLRYLEKSGIIPGVKLTVLEKAPFDGPVKIMLEDKETTIGNSVAKDVFLVERD